jgi:hypothetical protein
MDTFAYLLVGTGRQVAERLFIPVIRVAGICEPEKMLTARATPVALIVMEGDEHYFVPLPGRIDMEELQREIADLKDRIGNGLQFCKL